MPLLQLKYHETGRDATVGPSMGQWNMINKVSYFHLLSIDNHRLMRTQYIAAVMDGAEKFSKQTL